MPNVGGYNKDNENCIQIKNQNKKRAVDVHEARGTVIFRQGSNGKLNSKI